VGGDLPAGLVGGVGYVAVGDPGAVQTLQNLARTLYRTVVRVEAPVEINE